MVPFRIKICGITQLADAMHAVGAGADAIGLNFVPGSPRCLSVDAAVHCLSDLPPSIRKVGVFANAQSDVILKLFEQLDLDYVQLHGDETPAFASSLELPYLRAIPCHSQTGEASLLAQIQHWRTASRPPSGLLLDGVVSGQFGGTGKTIDWALAKGTVEKILDIPVILAGGLEPGNVAEAIELVRPAGVDVASGVEVTSGIKSPKLVIAFVGQALLALGDSEPG